MPPFPAGAVLAPPDGNLLGGATLTKDEVATLQTAVSAFASAYTSGSDPKADLAAVNALETSLGTLASSLWQRTPPAVPNTGMVVNGGTASSLPTGMG
jgi:hypothetical protein